MLNKFLLILNLFFVLELQANSYMVDVITQDNTENKYKVGLGVSFLEKNLICFFFNKEEILIDLKGKLHNYFSNTYKEHKISLSGRSLNTYFIFNSDKIRYRIGYAILDSMKYRISTQNELLSINYGREYSIGTWVILFPSTIVSDEVLLGVNNCFVIQNLDFLNSESINYKINSEFRLYELSLNLIFSKSLSKLLNLSYGFDVVYREFSFIDKYDYSKINGSSYTSSMHVTATLSLTRKEKINFEVSFSLLKELNIYSSYSIKL